jgi:hypothetical protein
MEEVMYLKDKINATGAVSVLHSELFEIWPSPEANEAFRNFFGHGDVFQSFCRNVYGCEKYTNAVTGGKVHYQQIQFAHESSTVFDEYPDLRLILEAKKANSKNRCLGAVSRYIAEDGNLTLNCFAEISRDMVRMGRNFDKLIGALSFDTIMKHLIVPMGYIAEKRTYPEAENMRKSFMRGTFRDDYAGLMEKFEHEGVYRALHNTINISAGPSMSLIASRTLMEAAVRYFHDLIRPRPHMFSPVFIYEDELCVFKRI